ncbi:MAG: hypothetical protein PHS84_04330 [Paludibacter sp.]|nr:hypothetical protein [Paludibacter sp.]
MNFRYLTIVALVFVCSYGYSQANNKYIQKEWRNQKAWLSKAVFESGYIIDNNRDTVLTKLLVFSKQKKMNPFLFCVSKDAHDSIRIFTAEKILEYRIGKTVYKKAKVENDHFFIKLLSTGNVTLFEREPIPSDSRFEYYLKKKNQQGYYEICPDGTNNQIIISSKPDLRIPNGNTVERFKEFVNIYFSGCEKVRNMVNAEIYSINDIPEIVEAYNKCSTAN